MKSSIPFQTSADELSTNRYEAVIAEDPFLYDHVAQSLKDLGFQGNAKKFFYNSVVAYGGVDREYHGWPHGRYVTTVPENEIFTVVRMFDLSLREIKHLRALVAVGGIRHDDVYLTIDHGYDTSRKPYLPSYADISGPPYRVKINLDLPEVGHLSLIPYGFKPGQVLSETPTKELSRGANEWLSSVCTGHDLSEGKQMNLEMKRNVIEVSTVQAATIAFQVDTPTLLFNRLTRNQNKDHRLDHRRALVATLAAVIVSNRDVDAFCGGSVHDYLTPHERFLKYLAGTWNLIPEANVGFKNIDYTPEQFLKALTASHNFSKNIINPDAIFHEFRGYPAPAIKWRMDAMSLRNLMLLDGYMTAKIASATLVDAFSKIDDHTGNVKLADLVNGMDTRLPPANENLYKASVDDRGEEIRRKRYENIIYATLIERKDPSAPRLASPKASPPAIWDTKGSPIARYLMQAIGMEGIRDIVAIAAKHKESVCDGKEPDPRVFILEIGRKYQEPLSKILEALLDITNTHLIERKMPKAGKAALMQRRHTLEGLIRDIAHPLRADETKPSLKDPAPKLT